MANIRPMKGVDALGKLNLLRFPMYLQPKYDGIRVLFYNGTALSSSLKPLRNTALQDYARKHSAMLDRIECEFYVPSSEGGFREATSICRNGGRSIDKGRLYAFDIMDDTIDYSKRFDLLLSKKLDSFITVAPTVEVTEVSQVEPLLNLHLDQGYEGVMLKRCDAMYKHGRATLKSQECLKLKPFVDDDAIIVGWKYEQENDNPAYIDELGRTKRSSAKEGKYDKPLIGAVLCICDKFVQPFWVSGFTTEEKEMMFKCRDRLEGTRITFKHQPCECYDAPRHPIFRRWL